MTRNPDPRPRRWLRCVSGLLLIATSCAEPSATTQVAVAVPPAPAGQARIWFYRDWLPSESLNLANIDVNGSYFGSVANGSAFYRDVQPGHYHIAPASYNRDFNQNRDVDLAPGADEAHRSALLGLDASELGHVVPGPPIMVARPAPAACGAG